MVDVAKNKAVKKPTFKDRIKNPIFLAAAAGLVYKLYTWLAAKYGLPTINSDDWRQGIDLLAYALIGAGISSSFTEKK